MSDIKHKVDSFIQELFIGRPPYDDGGAGNYNSEVLTKARVRPAFFDTSCLLYRLAYAKADTYCKKAGDDDTLLIHLMCVDFMRDVVDACGHFACGPVFAFDSVAKYRKDELLPTYKEKRNEQKKTAEQERTIALLPLTRYTLKSVYCPAYRIQSFCVHGYESDDVIASFVLGLKQKALMAHCVYPHPVVVITNDHDLHQLIHDDVYMADVATGVMANSEQIARHTGIKPEEVVACKTIGGCKSDKVPNVPGCGEVTVKEIMVSHNSDVKQKKAREALQSEEGLAILRRNLKLVRLPYEGKVPMPPLKLSGEIWPANCVPEKMQIVYIEYGIKREDWPAFGDVTLPRPVGAVPLCAWVKKEE